MRARKVHSEKEFDDLRAFLRANKLPYQDVAPGASIFQVYVDASDKIIASGGVEFYSNRGLLRSIAVDEQHRHQSVGSRMLNDLLSQARMKSVIEVFLLTETAPTYFKKFGFDERTRDSVPIDVMRSTEFSTVCPSTAVCMSKVIKIN